MKKRVYLFMMVFAMILFPSSIFAKTISVNNEDELLEGLNSYQTGDTIELNNDIDCMKILRKEVERSNSIEENMSNNEVKSEFDSLERLITKEIDNLSEIKKRALYVMLK